MGISTAINQKTFVSPQQKVQINLIYTHNYFDSSLKEILKAYQILSQHFNILKILKGSQKESLSYSEIVKVMLDGNSDVTRLLNKLVSLGFVQREVNPFSKRSVLISITPLGLTTTLEIEKKVNACIHRNVNLTDEEANTLSSLLDKMRG
jgi:DNA-binding MarR family transcriptional regulator